MSISQKHELPNLEPEQLSLLEDLYKIGAATPIQLEIKTNRIGKNVRSQLKELSDSGYVKRKTFTGGIENEVFTVSPKGYQQIRNSLGEPHKLTKSETKFAVNNSTGKPKFS
jgi:hypothetical protein